VGIYAAYDVTRDLRHTSTTVADHHARLILRWERDAHLAIEHPLNHALDHLPVVAVLAAYFYATLHFIITPAVLVWLYRAHPDVYRSARTWLATATVSALVGFWLFPVTPPRLLPGSGIHDTLADVHQWGWWSGQTSTPSGTGNLVNEFAAMPSLHVAWAVWSGWLIARHAQRGWVRVLGAAYPMLTALVVLSTGNHYVADVLAGAALIVITAATTTSRPRHSRDTCACRKPHPRSSALGFSGLGHPGTILGCGSAPRLPEHHPAVRVAATVAAFRVVEDRRDLIATTPAHCVAAPGRGATEDELG
jgi:membrane-associated phospholipid phosphatase